jgi:hypothetical protein
MTACDEPFYGVVPSKAAYLIGRVCLSVTFGTKENFRTEYLTFEVADFRSSYHAILSRPMLAKFMAIPHYLPHHEDVSAKWNHFRPRGHHGLLQLRERYRRAIQRLRGQSCNNGHGRPGNQNRPNHSRGAGAEAHKHNFGPKSSCKEGLPRPPDASKEVVIEANLDPK